MLSSVSYKWTMCHNNPFMIPFNSGTERFSGEKPCDEALPFTAFSSPYLGIRAMARIIMSCLKRKVDPIEYVVSFLPDSEFQTNLLCTPRNIDDNVLSWCFFMTNCLGSFWDDIDRQYINSVFVAFWYNEYHKPKFKKHVSKSQM